MKTLYLLLYICYFVSYLAEHKYMLCEVTDEVSKRTTSRGEVTHITKIELAIYKNTLSVQLWP